MYFVLIYHLSGVLTGISWNRPVKWIVKEGKKKKKKPYKPCQKYCMCLCLHNWQNGTLNSSTCTKQIFSLGCPHLTIEMWREIKFSKLLSSFSSICLFSLHVFYAASVCPKHRAQKSPLAANFIHLSGLSPCSGKESWKLVPHYLSLLERKEYE